MTATGVWSLEAAAVFIGIFFPSLTKLFSIFLCFFFFLKKKFINFTERVS